MAGGAAADADSVVALRLQIEEGVKGGHAVNAGQRKRCFRGDVLECFRGEILVGVVLLHRFQNAEERAWAVTEPGNHLIDEKLFRRRERVDRGCLHGTPFEGTRTAIRKRSYVRCRGRLVAAA